MKSMHSTIQPLNRAVLRSITMVLALTTTALVCINFHNPLSFKLGCILLGWILWTFVEYAWHRWLMHGSRSHPALNQVNVHLHHHQHPSELKVSTLHRILFFVGILISLQFTSICNNYWNLLTGFYGGIAFFCYIHVLLHRKWSASIFPTLLKYHLAHHLKYPKTGYGVSVVWWDDILQSAPPAHFTPTEKQWALYFKR